MEETCADCGKPITMGQASYYRCARDGDIGQTYHSSCGDPLGIRALKIAAEDVVRDYPEAAGTTGRLSEEEQGYGSIKALRQALEALK